MFAPMPRKPRIDFPGAWHHVMHRGARRADIFASNQDCIALLGIIGDSIERHEIEVHGYSLMPNHYHLLIRSRHGNLSSAMQSINGPFTQRMNSTHGWDGPVFRGRFRSELVEDETRLPYVLAYIHLNPLRANLVTRLDSEAWTSHNSYAGRERDVDWLTTSYFLDLLGDGPAIEEYVHKLHMGGAEWPASIDLESGFFGHHQEVAEQHSQAQFESRFVDPERLIERITEVTGVGIKELCTSRHGPGANPGRRFAVWALARRTRATQREIASLLEMSPSQVANVLHRIRPSQPPFDKWRDLLDDKV